MNTKIEKEGESTEDTSEVKELDFAAGILEIEEVCIHFKSTLSAFAFFFFTGFTSLLFVQVFLEFLRREIRKL